MVVLFCAWCLGIGMRYLFNLFKHGRKSAITADFLLYFLDNSGGTLLPQIDVRSHDDFNMVLRNFKRSCERAGVIAGVRKKEFYEKPTWVRKRKKEAALKRIRRKAMREKNRAVRLY